MRGTDHLFFLNSITTYSMLHFHWFLIVFCSIVLIEATVYYLYWKKPVMALITSIIGNICSALVAVPFLIFTIANSENIGRNLNWIDIIIMGERIVTDPANIFVHIMLGTLFFFLIALFISIISEVLIVRLVIEKQKHDLQIFTLANSITYICIILALLSLGAIFGLFNQNPELSVEIFYGEWLFVSLDDYVLDYNTFGGFMDLWIYLLIIISIVSLVHFLPKPTNLPQKDE